MMRQPPLARNLLCLCCLLIPFGGGCSSQGARKYPVSGTVLINGEPAPGVLVRFISSDTDLVGQDRQPVAITNERGEFQLSSFGDNDGAAEGKYRVTFFWPTNILTMTTDRLQGAFVDPKTSIFEVQIPPRPSTLEPFRLILAPERILPSEEVPGESPEEKSARRLDNPPSRRFNTETESQYLTC